MTSRFLPELDTKLESVCGPIFDKSLNGVDLAAGINEASVDLAVSPLGTFLLPF